MKSKLVGSIAIAMVTMIALSMLSLLPVASAVPNFYMTPSTNPPTKALNFKWNITVWVTGWGTPAVKGFQVTLGYNKVAAGINLTRAWLPAPTDTTYIFTGHATSRPNAFIQNGPTYYVKIGDTTLDTPATPPPEPAKVAIIEFQIIAAPGKFAEFSTPLEFLAINIDTFLLDDSLLTIPTTATNGSYLWTWVAPTTLPNMAIRFMNPNPGDLRITMTDLQHITFGQYPPTWNSTNFNANVYIENLDVGWAISGATFSVSYNASLTNLVGTTLDPAWSGAVDTSTPGIVIVPVTTTSSLAGNVLVLTLQFHIQGQHNVSAPPVPPYLPGYVDVSHVDFSGVALADHVGPIGTNPSKNGVVTVFAMSALLAPWLSVSPSSIDSGTDLVVGDQFGKTFTVDVRVNALSVFSRVVAIQFRLQYDHNLVTFIGATEGPYLSQFPNQPAPPYTFFVAVNSIGDPLYGDNVAIGDLLLPDNLGVWTNFPGDTSQSGPLATGVIATLTFAYAYQDFVNTYNMPLVIADFAVPPDPQTYFIDDLNHVVTSGTNLGGMVTIDPISTIGRRIDVWMQYPAPFGGQGVNQPADLVVPQQEIILTAKVTYNWWPVAQKKVTFNIYDGQHNVVAVLTALTGSDGHAVVSFRMPWPDVDPESLFGVWTVVASASVADVTITDTLQFHYDYLVNVFSVTTDKISYEHLDYVLVTVTYGSQAQQEYDVTLAETLTDNLGVPVSVAWASSTVSGAVFCSYKNYGPTTMSLLIPNYAYAGLATVHVNFLDLPPTDGSHVAVTAEHTAAIYILPV